MINEFQLKQSKSKLTNRKSIFNKSTCVNALMFQNKTLEFRESHVNLQFVFGTSKKKNYFIGMNLRQCLDKTGPIDLSPPARSD